MIKYEPVYVIRKSTIFFFDSIYTWMERRYLYLSLLLQVHCSENGKHFRSKMQSEHIELLQSPWLIELGAFYLNLDGSDGGDYSEISSRFSCDLNATRPLMTMSLPDSRKLDYDLTCAICLVQLYFWVHIKTRKEAFFVAGLDLCLDFLVGNCIQSICFELRASFLQVVCVFCCFCAHLWRT